MPDLLSNARPAREMHERINEHIRAIFRANAERQLSRMLDLANAEYGVIDVPQAGELVLLGASTYRTSPRGQLDTTGSTSAYPSSATLSGRAPSATHHDGLYAVLANAGTSWQYVAGSGFTPIAHPFQEITVVHDLIWAKGLGKFIACGADGSGDGSVESSPDGSVWTVETTGADWWATQVGSPVDITNRCRFIAHDGDQTVLVGCEYDADSGVDSRMAYTKDGGATWDWVLHRILGTSDFQCAGLAYDRARGLWLATDYGSDDLYACMVPREHPDASAGTSNWFKVCDLPNDYGGEIVTAGDLWIVHCGDIEGGDTVSGDAEAYVSEDGGQTWQGLGLGEAATSGQQLRLAGGRLVIGEDYLSGVFA